MGYRDGTKIRSVANRYVPEKRKKDRGSLNKIRRSFLGGDGHDEPNKKKDVKHGSTVRFCHTITKKRARKPSKRHAGNQVRGAENKLAVAMRYESGGMKRKIQPQIPSIPTEQVAS